MELSIVRTMVNKGFDNDLMDGRTVKAFRRTKRKLKMGANARERTLSVEEYSRLYAAAADHLKPILVTALHTGMRRGEILALRWSHLDRENGFIRLSADMTKEGKAKRIPINSHVRAVLDALPSPIRADLPVFTFRGKALGDNFRKSLVTACEEAKIPFGHKTAGGFVFHDIRSTVKTNMLRAGVDKALRDVILGHSLRGMDAYYLKPSDEDLQTAMGRYTAWLDAQMKNVAQNVAQKAKRG
jgi:integrase